MRHLLTSILVVLFLFISSAFSAQNLPQTKGFGLVVGVYQGQVRGGLPGETVFFTNQAGQLEAVYFTHTGNFTDVGHLFNMELCCGGIIKGEWKEENLSGKFIIVFQDPYYRHFLGSWGDMNDPENGGLLEGNKAFQP